MDKLIHTLSTFANLDPDFKQIDQPSLQTIRQCFEPKDEYFVDDKIYQVSQLVSEINKYDKDKLGLEIEIFRDLLEKRDTLLSNFIISTLQSDESGQNGAIDELKKLTTIIELAETINAYKVDKLDEWDTFLGERDGLLSNLSDRSIKLSDRSIKELKTLRKKCKIAQMKEKLITHMNRRLTLGKAYDPTGHQEETKQAVDAFFIEKKINTRDHIALIGQHI